MENELKQYLDEMKRDLRGHVSDAETRIMKHVSDVETQIIDRVDGRIDAVEERLKEYIAHADRDLETKIITEFHKWGRTSDMRTRQALTEASALNERMLAVEDRVSSLERSRAS